MKKILSFIMITSMLLGMIAMTSFGQTTGDIDTSNNLYAYDKSATALYNGWFTDVTLTVGGDENVIGSDIIYIVGSYAANSDGTPNARGDVLISSLVETIEEMVAAGTHVNFGMVPFSSDNVVAMPLTKIDSTNIDQLTTMIESALATCKSLYDGVNMENALIKAKKMFSESELADHPERQHLVMITSGLTYYFNSGANNEYVSTVPVRISGYAGKLFCTNKGWMQARTGQGDTYPLPKAFSVNNDSSDWALYWSYIDKWARADIEAGDEVVYETVTIESGDFLNWVGTWAGSSSGTGKYIAGTFTEDELAKYPYVTRLGNYNAKNPLEEESAQHAILYERAMWEAYEYSKANITGAGINFYPIYNALSYKYTNGYRPDAASIDWTTQYIGHSFVNMLAGGEAIKYETKGDKTFFAPIKDEITNFLSIGTTVEDYIGYDADETEGYNFEFIDMINGEAKLPVLKVGNKTYITTKLEAAVEGATYSYVFAAEEGADPTFAMDYYYGNGTTEEMFVWTFNENVTKDANVSLTYTLELAQRSTVVGEHIAYTNISAVLHPIDSNKVEGEDEYFVRPFVTYVVLPETLSVTVEKIWVGDEDEEDLRPESITVKLYANEELVATQEITAENQWTWTFEGLAKYSEDQEIVYTIEEVSVENYETEIDGDYKVGFVITNTYSVNIPDTPPPQTGDGAVVLIVLAIVSIAAGAVLVAAKKREI